MKICTICLKVYGDDEVAVCCGKDLTDVISCSIGSVFIGNNEPDRQYVKYYYVDESIPHLKKK